ncbi:hypothetical protein OAL32_01025 [Synechococcus sp. AH-551-G15]|nr:hypothetical protein [Synechococcus sp. AH-551-G15]
MTGLKINSETKKNFLINSLQPRLESVWVNMNRGIASNKYQVNAENEKQAITSMVKRMFELRLRLDHANAISEYSGENIIYSMPNCRLTSCFPAAIYQKLSEANPFAPGTNSQIQAIEATASAVTR